MRWLVCFGKVLLFCFSCGFIIALLSGALAGLPAAAGTLLIAVIATAGSYMVTFLFTRWDNLRVRDVGAVPTCHTPRRLLSGLLIGVFLGLLHPLLVLAAGHVKFAWSNIDVFSIIISFITYFMLACREEISFRGYPLFALNSKLGYLPAQIIVAFIFGLEHLLGGTPPLQAFLGAGTGSLLFGLAALRTKGLALPIGIHAGWNFAQWAVGFKGVAGILNENVDKGFEDWVSWSVLSGYLIVMIAAMLSINYYYKRRRPIDPNS